MPEDIACAKGPIQGECCVQEIKEPAKPILERGTEGDTGLGPVLYLFCPSG